MKITAVTAVYKRPEVFEFFAKGIKEMGSVEMVVVGSEDYYKDIVKGHGFHYVEAPNQPLTHKHNVGVLKARELESDYVLLLGSDDVIHPDTWNYYLKKIKEGFTFICTTDLYFYNLENKKALYWGGYTEKNRKDHPAGPGKVIAKEILNQWKWEPFMPGHDGILDTSIQRRLEVTKCKYFSFRLKDEGLYSLDIKSGFNMTPFAVWNNSEFIDADKLKAQFNYLGL